MELIGQINEFLSKVQTDFEGVVQRAQTELSAISKFNNDLQQAQKLFEAEIAKIKSRQKDAADKYQKCYDDKNKAMEQIQKDTTEDVNKINAKFKTKIDNLKGDVEIGLSRIKAFIKESQTKIEQVLKDNAANPAAMIEKMKEQCGPITKSFESVQKDIGKKMKDISDKQEAIVKDVNKDLETLDAKNKKIFEKILADFQKCSENVK